MSFYLLFAFFVPKFSTVLQSYEETLTYLYERLPMFSRIGVAAYKKDLHNTTALCAAFDNPERKIKTIHIAGTNGKGSTSHMLAAIFHKAGYKTGLYTSPHLKDFRERITVSGDKAQPLQMVPKDFITEFTVQAEPFIEVLQPSFFELTVVMAFQFFVEQQVDIAIIETGLGGRLDSTNVITPELSIITNISLDHTYLLGNTLEEIAAEKAGIIKPGIPVVIGEKLEETEKVFCDKVDAVKASVCWAEEYYFLKSYEAGVKYLKSEWRALGETDTFFISTDLPGIYQLKNLRTVLTAVAILKQKGYTLPNTVVADALQHVTELTGLHARWETIHEKPRIILDVAHNEAGIRQIIEQLILLNAAQETTVHIILGMVKDKAVTDVLKLFPAHYHYYFTEANLPRALPAHELQTKAMEAGLSGNIYEDVNKAIQVAKKAASPTDTIVVCGSVFLVGEVEQLVIDN